MLGSKKYTIVFCCGFWHSVANLSNMLNICYNAPSSSISLAGCWVTTAGRRPPPIPVTHVDLFFFLVPFVSMMLLFIFRVLTTLFSGLVLTFSHKDYEKLRSSIIEAAQWPNNGRQYLLVLSTWGNISLNRLSRTSQHSFICFLWSSKFSMSRNGS